MDTPLLIEILIDIAIKSTVLLAIAGAAALALPRASAATRHLIWCLAVLGALTLPVLGALLPAWRVLPQPPAAAADAAPTPVRHGPFSAHAPTSAPESLPASAPALPSAAPPPASSPPAAPASLADTSPGFLGLFRPEMILAAWFSGTGLVLLPLLLSALSLRHLRRTARPLTDPAWTRLCDTLAAGLRLRRPVILLHSPCRTMPLTWGVTCGLLPSDPAKVLLPEEAADWSPDRRRAVLLHELAHVKRLDTTTQLLTQLACALYWWNPLIWLAARRMTIERERACDDLVLTAGVKGTSESGGGATSGGASDYADHLLQLATGLDAGRLSRFAAIAMARPSQLEGRLIAILDPKRNRKALTARTLAAALLIVSLIVVPLAMLRAATDFNDPETLCAIAEKLIKNLATDDVQSADGIIVGDDAAGHLQRFAGDLELESIYARSEPHDFAILNFRTTTREDDEFVKVRLGLDGSGGEWVLRSVSSGPASVIDKTLRHVLDQMPAQRLIWGTALSSFVAELPGHITVEFVGLASHPSATEAWWDPSGRPLATPPASTGEIWYRAPDFRILERAVRITGIRDEDLSIKSDGGGSSQLSRNDDGSYLWLQAFGIKPDEQTFDMRLGVAFDPWTTVAEAGARDRASSSGQHGNFAFGGAAHRPDGGSVLNVMHDVTDRDYRIVAITQDGEIATGRQGTSGAGGFLQTTVEFRDLPLEQIDRFHFQTRPYHWVEFRNVSLRPGHETAVETEITAAPPDVRTTGVEAENASVAAQTPPAEAGSAEAGRASNQPAPINVHRRIEQMRQALLGLTMYAEGHDRWPATLGQIQPYMDNADSLDDLTYTGPTTAPDQTEPTTPLLIERQPIQAGWRIIGYADGHVENVRANEAKAPGQSSSSLEFRVVPTRDTLSAMAKAMGGNAADELNDAAITEAKRRLAEDGKASMRDGPFAWLPMHRDFDLAEQDMITADHAGRRYLLVANRDPLVLRFGPKVAGQGQVHSAQAVEDQRGRPAVRFELDERGGVSMNELSRKHIGHSLAIVLDEEVLTTPTLHTPISSIGIITGRFSDEEIERLVERLNAIIEGHDDQGTGQDAPTLPPAPDSPAVQISPDSNEHGPAGANMWLLNQTRPDGADPQTPGWTAIEDVVRGGHAAEYAWRVDPSEPVRVSLGWARWRGDRLREHAGAGTSGTGSAQPRDVVVRLGQEDGELNMVFGRRWVEGKGPNGGESTMTKRLERPQGASLRIRWLGPGEQTLRSDRYLTLWEGQWVRDGEVVDRVAIMARLVGLGEEYEGFLVRGDERPIVEIDEAGFGLQKVPVGEAEVAAIEVTELLIRDDNAGEQMFVDFDTRTLITPPGDLDNTDVDAVQAWLREHGVDAIGETNVDVHGLVGFDLIAVPIVSERWDRITADSFTDDTFRTATPGNPVFLSAKGDLPQTWMVQTREGGRLVLQIIGFSDDPRGVHVRYKVVGHAAEVRQLLLEIDIDSDGTIDVGDWVVSPEALRAHVTRTKPVEVMVRAATDLPYSAIIPLIELLQQAGAGNIRLATVKSLKVKDQEAATVPVE